MAEPMAEPAWLTAKVDQRVAMMAEALRGVALGDFGVAMTTLTEPDEGASPEERERWERTCDNCGTYCPGKFFTGRTEREVHGVKTTIVYGACPTCAGLS